MVRLSGRLFKSIALLLFVWSLFVLCIGLLRRAGDIEMATLSKPSDQVDRFNELADLNPLSQTATRATTTGHGPGLGKITFPESDLFQVIGRINAENGAPRSHGFVSMHNGYLVVIFAIGGGRHHGGFAFYDISEPYTPTLVSSRDDDETFEIREAHNYGYSSSYGGEFAGKDLVAIQARRGVQIWDWTDIYTATRVSYLHMPGISGGDYTNANWWTFWQAPYIYVAGADSGIYIIDATDPREPVLVDRKEFSNPIPISLTGGFRIGSLYAVGNLLVVAGNDVPGYATLDISDPVNPILLDSTVMGPENYSVLVNGNRIFGAARFKELYIHDISDPQNIQQTGYFKGTNDKGGYLSYQDGYIHMGASINYVKIDVQDESNIIRVGLASSGIPDRDEDFATVLGNIVVLGDDHENGSFLIPHQSEPDNLGPIVNMISPLNGAVKQLASSRIGLTFSDLIDLRTVNNQTIQVRPIISGVVTDPLNGHFSGQSAIVNFTPADPLMANTVYEVFVPAGGVTDVSQNGLRVDYRAYFSTGSEISAPPSCEIAPVDAIKVGESVAITATALSGITPFTYTWDFGDGGQPSQTAMDGHITHAYPSAGHYVVRATISNQDGSASCVTGITVHYPIGNHPARGTTTILVDQDGSTIWNVNPDNNTVTAINTTGYAKQLEAEVGKKPTTLAQAPDGLIWVVTQDDGAVSLLDPGLASVVDKIELAIGSQPYGIVISAGQELHASGTAEGSFAYISLQAAGKLLKIDVDSRQIVGELTVVPTPRGMALSGDGSRLFIGRFISPQDRGEVVEVNPDALSIASTHVLPFDPGPDTESSGRGVPNALGQLAISPDNRRLWIPAKKDNIARGLFSDGQGHTFDSTVRTIAAQIDLEDNLERLSARHDFENSDRAIAVAFTALGDYAFVALQGSNAVAVLDVYSGQMVTQLPEVGKAPVGLVLSESGSRLFVHSYLSRSVSIYDVPRLLAGNVDARQPLKVVDAVADEMLSADVLRGKQIFHDATDSRMNQDGYISCASCHMDGGQDGRIWDRGIHGEGVRNTISLIGRGGMAHGLLHWSANFDEIQDFEHDMRTAFGGQGFLTDGDFSHGLRSHPLGTLKAGLDTDLDALAGYVSSLTDIPSSPFRNPDGALTSDGVAGKQIFERLNCSKCHGGTHFTDSELGLVHDIGTVQTSTGHRLGQPILGIDTPTLQGLWGSAPYFHNGSQASLSDLLLASNINRLHGEAGMLSTLEQDQLLSYLVQIDGRESGPPLNERPVQLIQPSANAQFSTAENILVEAASPKPLRRVSQVEFYIDGIEIGSSSAPPYQVVWQSPSLAQPRIHLVAAMIRYDNGDGSAHQRAIIIDPSIPTRTPTPTPSPTPSLTPTQTPTAEPLSPSPAPTSTPNPFPSGTGNGEEGVNQLFVPLSAH